MEGAIQIVGLYFRVGFCDQNIGIDPRVYKQQWLIPRTLQSILYLDEWGFVSIARNKLLSLYIIANITILINTPDKKPNTCM